MTDKSIREFCDWLYATLAEAHHRRRKIEIEVNGGVKQVGEVDGWAKIAAGDELDVSVSVRRPAIT